MSDDASLRLYGEPDWDGVLLSAQEEISHIWGQLNAGASANVIEDRLAVHISGVELRRQLKGANPRTKANVIANEFQRGFPVGESWPYATWGMWGNLLGNRDVEGVVTAETLAHLHKVLSSRDLARIPLTSDAATPPALRAALTTGPDSTLMHEEIDEFAGFLKVHTWAPHDEEVAEHHLVLVAAGENAEKVLDEAHDLWESALLPTRVTCLVAGPERWSPKLGEQLRQEIAMALMYEPGAFHSDSRNQIAAYQENGFVPPLRGRFSITVLTPEADIGGYALAAVTPFASRVDRRWIEPDVVATFPGRAAPREAAGLPNPSQLTDEQLIAFIDARKRVQRLGLRPGNQSDKVFPVDPDSLVVQLHHQHYVASIGVLPSQIRETITLGSRPGSDEDQDVEMPSWMDLHGPKEWPKHIQNQSTQRPPGRSPGRN